MMPTVSEHEVIVVGAGPGGATTAAALARQGRDVLLHPRLNAIGFRALASGASP